jgi:U3 small nucleolar RNA-associated protein 19
MAYPNFYDKLYSIVKPEMFNMSYRNTFLELLDAFMKSTHLTAYIIAAFVKKFARIALRVPPHASQFLIALIYNLLHRHQQVRIMVHNADIAQRNKQKLVKKQTLQLGEINVESQEDENQGIDPYNYNETNLKKCGALQSSLWEIETLKNHYDPTVSQLATSFKQNILDNKVEYNIKEFIPISYDSEFQKGLNFTQTSKKKKKALSNAEVALEFRKKPSLFDKTDRAFSAFAL